MSIITNIEETKETEKFLFFRVSYMKKVGWFRTREVSSECFIRKFAEKGIATTIYINGATQKWWESPSHWHAVQAYAHYHDLPLLKEHIVI